MGEGRALDASLRMMHALVSYYLLFSIIQLGYRLSEYSSRQLNMWSCSGEYDCLQGAHSHGRIHP